MKNKCEIFGLTEKELAEAIVDLPIQPFRAKQLTKWFYKKHVWDFAAMSDIAQKDSVLLREHFTVLPQETSIIARQSSSGDSTVKLLIRLADGNTVETVGMLHDYGYSACISSQVGCAMNCGFCASALNGFVRNLSAAEMLLQAALLQKHFVVPGGRLSHIIIMGSGEPLLNYGELIKFLHLLHDSAIYNIGFRHITISTCGIVPGMVKLAEENLPVSLAVSLHAPIDELRGKFMPINNKYKIADVLKAASEYFKKTGRQVTYEYLLVKNINSGVAMAEKLAGLLTKTGCAVNLIPVNPVSGKGWERPEKKEIEKFSEILKEHGITSTVRREMGADIQAACGQLRASRDGQIGS